LLEALRPYFCRDDFTSIRWSFLLAKTPNCASSR
jgi:hypothetical protein